MDDALAEWLAAVAEPMRELRGLLRAHHAARGGHSLAVYGRIHGGTRCAPWEEPQTKPGCSEKEGLSHVARLLWPTRPASCASAASLGACFAWKHGGPCTYTNMCDSCLAGGAVARLEELGPAAAAALWWPTTQHSHVAQADVQVRHMREPGSDAHRGLHRYQSVRNGVSLGLLQEYSTSGTSQTSQGHGKGVGPVLCP